MIQKLVDNHEIRIFDQYGDPKGRVEVSLSSHRVLVTLRHTNGMKGSKSNPIIAECEINGADDLSFSLYFSASQLDIINICRSISDLVRDNLRSLGLEMSNDECEPEG